MYSFVPDVGLGNVFLYFSVVRKGRVLTVTVREGPEGE